MTARLLLGAALLAITACSQPNPAASTSDAPAVEPPPEVISGDSSEGYAEAMARGEGLWFRGSGACSITMEFLPATDGTLVRREATGDDRAEMRHDVEPNAVRVDGANEMRWTTSNGEARFVWQDEYATLLVGERRCEYSRGLVRGSRPNTLP